MSKKYKALVTAIGGDIGQSIARVLRRLDIIDRIVGTDITDDHPGNFFVDRCYKVPRADSPEFLEQLKGVVEREKIDFVIPVSEPEIKVIHQAHASGWSPTRLVFPRGLVLPTCLDKLETVRFLNAHGITIPWTVPVAEGMPLAFPCIFKDRWSWGSKSIVMIDEMETARFYASRRPHGVFQELLLPDDEEYTCGVFRSRAGDVATVVFRRTLEGAQTGKATVVTDPRIEELCTAVARALQLRGSINVQLRKTKKGPILFEINARFSSTVIFRELIGFQDVLWSLQDLLGENFIPSFSPPIGTKFYRVFTEKITPPSV